MNADAAGSAVGVLILSHGSPRAEANAAFARLAARVAARIGNAQTLAAYFSAGRPDIVAGAAELTARGMRRVLVMPCFLNAGLHVTVDIPALLEQCRRQWPHVQFALLPTLEDDAAVEDAVVERLIAHGEAPAGLSGDAVAFERRRLEIIERQLADFGPGDPQLRRIMGRILDATADLALARSLRMHPQAAQQGMAALVAGRPVVCDSRPLQFGLDETPGGTILAERDPGRLAAQIDGAVVAVGSDVIALWKVVELAGQDQARPALVVGLPAGLAGAREAKAALAESDLRHITNLGVRGGAAAAAAAVNALADMLAAVHPRADG